jgi:hypothetical protein
MATLQAQYNLTQNATVQQTIRMSMIGNALTVVSEAADSGHPNKHIKRHDLAVMVLRDPDYWQPRFVGAAAAQDQLTGSSTDAQINAAVALLFDKIAGVDISD